MITSHDAHTRTACIAVAIGACQAVIHDPPAGDRPPSLDAQTCAAPDTSRSHLLFSRYGCKRST